MRDAVGKPTPRDYICFFRNVIECERQRTEDEGGGPWLRRHCFNQQSLLNARKIYSREKLNSLIGEFPACDKIADWVRKSGRREIKPDLLVTLLGGSVDVDIKRICDLGLLRYGSDNCEYEVPWFYFDLLVPRQRQQSVGYDVPRGGANNADVGVDPERIVVKFVRGNYSFDGQQEAVLLEGRKVRLPKDCIDILRDFYRLINRPVWFWVYATIQKSWLVRCSNSFIEGVLYDFRIDLLSEQAAIVICIDTRIGHEMPIKTKDAAKVMTEGLVSGFVGLSDGGEMECTIVRLNTQS